MKGSGCYIPESSLIILSRRRGGTGQEPRFYGFTCLLKSLFPRSFWQIKVSRQLLSPRPRPFLDELAAGSTPVCHRLPMPHRRVAGILLRIPTKFSGKSQGQGPIRTRINPGAPLAWCPQSPARIAAATSLSHPCIVLSSQPSRSSPLILTPPRRRHRALHH